VTGNATHEYLLAGTYTVQITGNFPKMSGFNASSDMAKLTSIEQWGDNQWESMHSFFLNARNMIYNASDAPDLTLVSDMASMFSGARAFNANLSDWDVSNVVNMSGMFQQARAFNGDISNWDVSPRGEYAKYVQQCCHL
jgi:surface protein